MSVLQRRVGAEELQRRASELQRRVGAAEFRSSSAPSSPRRGDTQKAAARHRTPPPGIERAMSISRLTFSFDSSGWLYVYHLGVAHFIQVCASARLRASACVRGRARTRKCTRCVRAAARTSEKAAGSFMRRGHM